MSDEKDATQVTRAHRAKRRGVAKVGRVDGGAVAVGLVVALAAFAPTLADVVPLWLAVVLVAVGLFMGGFVSGFLRDADTACEACHGALVGASFLAVVMGVVASTILSGGDPTDLVLVGLLEGGLPVAGIAILLAIGFGVLGGYFSMLNPRAPTS